MKMHQIVLSTLLAAGFTAIAGTGSAALVNPYGGNFSSLALPAAGTEYYFFAGQSLYSPNLTYRAGQQSDGNFVLYGSTAWWATSMCTSNWRNGAEMVWQADGNLVEYGLDRSVVWKSGTNNKGASVLAMQNDGNLVIYKSSGSIWNTGTNGKAAWDIPNGASQATLLESGYSRFDAAHMYNAVSNLNQWDCARKCALDTQISSPEGYSWCVAYYWTSAANGVASVCRLMNSVPTTRNSQAGAVSGYIVGRPAGIWPCSLVLPRQVAVPRLAGTWGSSSPYRDQRRQRDRHSRIPHAPKPSERVGTVYCRRSQRPIAQPSRQPGLEM
jgi:hypothetical protein